MVVVAVADDQGVHLGDIDLQEFKVVGVDIRRETEVEQIATCHWNARLGADADRYCFTVVDLHLPLSAGFTGAPKVLTDAPRGQSDAIIGPRRSSG